MKAKSRSWSQRFCSLLNIAGLFWAGIFALLSPAPGFSQDTAAPPSQLSADDLDRVVARIALYPDPLLAQVMAAASFSDQIPDAYKWTQSHASLRGDALVQAMEKESLSYDPSVQALIPFPSVLKIMVDDQAWAAKLGGAVLTQRGDVMDSVQRMRKKAHDAGNLKTTQQITVVESSPQIIEIQPANPQVIYVPTYNPQVVYVPAPAGPSTGDVVAAALIGFTVGVAITAAFSDGWWGHRGGFVWSSHTVVIHNSAWGRTWVNHTTYVHTWGGYNRGFYSRPNAWVNRSTNINRNVNVNRNINVNNNVNVNNNRNRNTNVNQNRNSNQNANRGFTPQNNSGSAFSGVDRGRSDAHAGARGRVHRR
jgi:hypothetical protein